MNILKLTTKVTAPKDIQIVVSELGVLSVVHRLSHPTQKPYCLIECYPTESGIIRESKKHLTPKEFEPFKQSIAISIFDESSNEKEAILSTALRLERKDREDTLDDLLGLVQTIVDSVM